jgi:hypothetical protein
MKNRLALSKPFSIRGSGTGSIAVCALTAWISLCPTLRFQGDFRAQGHPGLQPRWLGRLTLGAAYRALGLPLVPELSVS